MDLVGQNLDNETSICKLIDGSKIIKVTEDCVESLQITSHACMTTVKIMWGSISYKICIQQNFVYKVNNSSSCRKSWPTIKIGSYSILKILV